MTESCMQFVQKAIYRRTFAGAWLAAAVNLVVREGRPPAPLSLPRQDDLMQECDRTEDDDGLDGESDIAADHAEDETDGKNRPLDPPPPARSVRFHSAAHSGCARPSAATSRRLFPSAFAS
jgi:hypothetical protein